MACWFRCCCCCCLCCCIKRPYYAKKLSESDIVEFDSTDLRYNKNHQNPKRNSPFRVVQGSTPTPPLSPTPDNPDQEFFNRDYDTFEACAQPIISAEEELPYMNRNIWFNPYTKEEFSLYFDKQMRGKNVGLKKEFDSLAPMRFRDSSDEAKTMENRKKNRAEPNFIPYDLTRVVLNKESNYINASTVDGFYRFKSKYIVAQLPILTTLGDFWEMVWQENVRCIVSITTEASQTVFWPKDKGADQVFADLVRVKLMNEHKSPCVEERSFVVSSEMENKKSNLLHHIEFKTDVKALEAPHACPILLSMVQQVTEVIENKPPDSKLCFVTKSCNSLVGILMALLEVMKPLSENCPFSLHQTMDHLLAFRCGLVTEFEHYELLYLTVLEHIQELRPLEFEDLVKLDVGDIDQEDDEVNPVKEEFDKVNLFCKKAYLLKTKDIALSPANKKHQLSNTASYDFNRVQLVRSPTDSDYINGSYIHMNSGKLPVIALAHPTKSSIKEFLWLIMSADIDMVLVLGKSEEIDMMNEGVTPALSYWGPLSGDKMYGEFRIERSQSSRHKGMMRQNIKILYEPVKQEHKEKTFLLCLYREWDENDLPTSNEGLLRVVEHLEEFRGSAEGKSPIVIQSIDGSTKIGLLLAVMNGFNAVKRKRQLDLPQIVKSLRADRMNMISCRVSA